MTSDLVRSHDPFSGHERPELSDDTEQEAGEPETATQPAAKETKAPAKPPVKRRAPRRAVRKAS